MLLNGCDAGMGSLGCIKQMSRVQEIATATSILIRRGVKTAPQCITCHHLNVRLIHVLTFRICNIWIRIHAKEESQVEHSLYLFNFEEVAHILHQFTLQLVSTFFVPAHRVTLLGQHWHVITRLFQSEACQFNDEI